MGSVYLYQYWDQFWTGISLFPISFPTLGLKNFFLCRTCCMHYDAWLRTMLLFFQQSTCLESTTRLYHGVTMNTFILMSTGQQRTNAIAPVSLGVGHTADARLHVTSLEVDVYSYCRAASTTRVYDLAKRRYASFCMECNLPQLRTTSWTHHCVRSPHTLPPQA